MPSLTVAVPREDDTRGAVHPSGQDRLSVGTFLSLHEENLLLQVYVVEGKRTPVELPVVITGLCGRGEIVLKRDTCRITGVVCFHV